MLSLIVLNVRECPRYMQVLKLLLLPKIRLKLIDSRLQMQQHPYNTNPIFPQWST